jgi:hypothetical protein
VAVEIDALSLAGGLVLLAIMGWDAFTSIVLPRAVGRRLRPSITVIRLLWAAWSALGGLIADRRRRQGMLAVFGPLSVILMLIVWATGLIFAFALLFVGVGAPLRGAVDTGQFARALYLSGTTLFTLGLGDVTPDSTLARILVVSEAATGLGFFAIVISYLPLLEQAFSQREVGVLLLASRAGSPPNGVRLLGRHANTENTAELLSVLREGEQWMAAILESHVAHGILVFYRSQRLGQSWLTTMVGVLDACALIVVGGRDSVEAQAKATLRLGVHIVGELCHALGMRVEPGRERLPATDLPALWAALVAAKAPLPDGPRAAEHLAELRRLYEPQAMALADQLLLALPHWLPEGDEEDPLANLWWLEHHRR